MVERFLLREILRRLRPSGTQLEPADAFLRQQYFCTSAFDVKDHKKENKQTNKWLSLPPFTPVADGRTIGKHIYRRSSGTVEEPVTSTSSMTALKWILKCCPDLPMSLVQKLFRLRQVRRESSVIETEEHRARRVGAKDLMDVGDRILLPKSVDRECVPIVAENHGLCNEEELELVRGLELYKDSAMIVINKPPRMPVQGGLGIKKSLDELAAKYLKYDQTDSPRLVHRLDRDSSGILVMGRTQLSATILHSVFREKTSTASNDIPGSKRSLEKSYWALVIGSPRRPKGVISVPLVKVVVDNGKSERITVVDNGNCTSAQHAVTEYRVIESSPSGYTWLELSPLTGRKHQLRVHCAEVLGTPIVGDYKYGWQAHKKLGHLLDSVSNMKLDRKIAKPKHDTFGSESESGNVSEKQFRLHLHCKKMVLPDISQILRSGNIIPDLDTALTQSFTVEAPLPAHMQRSWDLLK